MHARALVNVEMLYGALRLFSNCVISGDENVAPSLTPARPKALIKVYMAIRFGHSVAHSTILDFSGAKSMYTSSTTATPFQVRCSSTYWISALAIKYPVGFPGVAI